MDKSVYDILVARLQIVFKPTNVNKLDSVQEACHIQSIFKSS